MQIQTEKVQKSQSSEKKGDQESGQSSSEESGGGESGQSSGEESGGGESEKSGSKEDSKGESGESSNEGSDAEESGESGKQESGKNNSQKLGEKETGESSNEGNSSDDGAGSDDEIKSMSVQYSESNEDSKLNWNDIRKNAQELSNSWDVIESDLLKKQNLNQNDFDGIKKSINGIIIDSTNEQKETLIKNSAELYSSLCPILEKINYDKSKIDFFKVKKYIYETYYFVLIDDWNSATGSLESVNTVVEQMDNVDSQTKVAFYNLLSSCDEKSKEIFYIRCSDVLSRIE